MISTDKITDRLLRENKSATILEFVREEYTAGPLSNGETIMAALDVFLSKFVIYPSHHARYAHALWIVHTHLMEIWDSTPRLAFLSAEPASGKTRALEVTELLAPLPVEAVNVSPAYLFRKVGAEEGRATILYDEIDTVFGPKAKENEEIRGLLNAGHRRGAVAGRCVMKGKNIETEEISAFSAVALAGLGWLPDTILSRAIVIRMRKRKGGETVQPFRRRLEERSGHALRDHINQWATIMAASWKGDWPAMPVGIEDRNADVWEPLLAIADAVGGVWPERARQAAVALVKAAQDREPSLNIRLLIDLRTVFADERAMSTAAILAALMALKEAPWNDLKKPLNDRGLAQRLRQFEIKSKSVKIAGTVLHGYRREDLYDAWERYLPSPQGSATSATFGNSGENPNDFNDETVADADETSATYPHSSATPEPSPQKVADSVAPVADEVAEKRSENDNEVNEVAEVAEVADLAGAERACIHCRFPGNDGDPVLEVSGGGRPVWLHRGCIAEWKNLDIPEFLRRPG